MPLHVRCCTVFGTVLKDGTECFQMHFERHRRKTSQIQSMPLFIPQTFPSLRDQRWILVFESTPHKQGHARNETLRRAKTFSFPTKLRESDKPIRRVYKSFDKGIWKMPERFSRETFAFVRLPLISTSLTFFLSNRRGTIIFQGNKSRFLYLSYIFSQVILNIERTIRDFFRKKRR